MCNKTDCRIECINCGYPYSEARYPDILEKPMQCNTSYEVLNNYINKITTRINKITANRKTVNKLE